MLKCPCNPELCHLVGSRSGQVPILEQHPPAGGRIDTAYTIEGARLAGPVRPYDGNKLLPAHLHGYVGEYRKSSRCKAHAIQVKWTFSAIPSTGAAVLFHV